MKKISLLLTLAFTVILSGSAFAEFVPQSQAIKVAKNHIKDVKVVYDNVRESGLEVELEHVFTAQDERGEAYYYIYNLVPAGFVIVSAEDVSNPILGYSLEGAYFPDKRNDVFEAWMIEYVDYIKHIRENKLTQTPEMKRRWDYFNNEEFMVQRSFSKDREEFGPLLPCLWNQNSPYNILCPESEAGPGGHVYAGCVATAMSMIMYYYQHPKQGKGSSQYYIAPYGQLTANYEETYYNWNAMTDAIDGNSTEHTVLAIAELMNHCGVAVRMMYDPQGSGAYSHDVPNAVIKHFRYSPDTKHKKKGDLAAWNLEVTNQLKANQPMYYSGREPKEGGHAFCLDGKQGADMFHFNFGWGGHLNGFYYLEGEGAVAGFAEGQAMVCDFFPDPNEYPHALENEVINSTGGIIYDGSAPRKPYGTNLSYGRVFEQAAGDSITKYEFKFLDIDLESTDKVKIYDGKDASAPLLIEVTGTDLPEPNVFKTTSNKAFVLFETDGNQTDHDGFRLEYKTIVPKFCSSSVTFTDDMGSFDDGSEDFNYSPSNLCRFKIEPKNAGSDSLRLWFDKFDLGKGDNVTVFQSSPTLKLADLSHTDTPEEFYYSKTGKAMIVLKSDRFFSGKGIQVSYALGALSVEEASIENMISIYPNPTSSTLTLNMEMEGVDDVMMTIFTIDGKVVAQEEFAKNRGGLFKVFDVSSYERGIYLMNVKTKHGVVTKRFIVE